MSITIYTENLWHMIDAGFTLISIGYRNETFRIVFFNFELGFIV
jgi:hypothetical protein